MCPQERFTYYKKPFRIVLFYKKDWAILLHFCYRYYLLLVMKYLATKLSVTYNFSVYRKYFAENRFHFLLLLIQFDTLTYRKDYD